MDDRDVLRDRFERHTPVDRRVAAANDDDLFISEVFDSLGEIMDAIAFELTDSGEIQTLRFKSADAGADDDSLAEPLAVARRQFQDAIRKQLETEHFFLQSNIRFIAHRLGNHLLDKI